MERNKLSTRQHRLKDYLKENFEIGKWFSIEELCSAGLGYTLNTNPKNHNKCIALHNDIRALNYATNVERYIPIIKDKNGACKLCENEQELETYVNSEKAKLDRQYKYYNHLHSLKFVDGVVVFLNLGDRPLDYSEMKPVEIYMKKDTQPITTDQSELCGVSK